MIRTKETGAGHKTTGRASSGTQAERAESGGKVNRRQGKKTGRGRAMGSKQEGRAESVEQLKVSNEARTVSRLFSTEISNS